VVVNVDPLLIVRITGAGHHGSIHAMYYSEVVTYLFNVARTNWSPPTVEILEWII
jgi:hypothetical protein